MNKQAITFLSLFSLILVLSIYYILVPPAEETPVSTTSSQSLTSIETMQNKLDTTHENAISDNNDVIASAGSSEDDINLALSSIQETKDIMDKEKELVNLIKEKGYKEVYVEVGKANIKVVINKKDATSQDASQVIRIINEKMGNNYEVEVKFITE